MQVNRAGGGSAAANDLVHLRVGRPYYWTIVEYRRCHAVGHAHPPSSDASSRVSDGAVLCPASESASRSAYLRGEGWGLVPAVAGTLTMARHMVSLESGWEDPAPTYHVRRDPWTGI